MPVHITSRSDAEAIIREQVVSTLFQDAPKQSVFMSMARKLPNMTSDQTRIRVLDFLPTAYWVDGDTGMKQTSRQAWDNVYLDAAELAVIVPIPEAVLDDAEFDIFGEITPRVNEAIGQRVDSAIIFGVNRPRVWQNDIITLARQAGNNVAPGSTPDYYNLLLGENGVISKVEGRHPDRKSTARLIITQPISPDRVGWNWSIASSAKMPGSGSSTINAPWEF